MTYNICYLFIFISEAIIFSYYCLQLCPDKMSKAINYFIIICLYTVLFGISFCRNPLINTTCFLGFNFIFLLIILKLSWTASLFHSAVITAFMGFCEVIVYSLLPSVPDDIFNHVLNTYKIILLSIISKLLYFIILYIISHTFLKRKPSDQLSPFEMAFLSLVPLLSIFIMITYIIIENINTLSNTMHFMIIFSALFLLIINIIVFSLYEYRNKKNIELTELQLLLQKESDYEQYYKLLLKQDENQKILIHDIKKHLNAIALLNDKKETMRVHDYIHNMLEFSDFQDPTKICNNDLLNAILCKYKNECEPYLISFNVDVRNNTINFMSDSDISSLFCNLLDNAIESASKSCNSFIDLNVIKKEGTSHTLITIRNTCTQNPFLHPLNILKTTKSDSYMHGIGMKSIKRIIAKYDGNMRVYYDESSKSFHTIILIKNANL